MDELATASATELLELDDRPVFVVDLRANPPFPVFFNASIRNTPSLENALREHWAEGHGDSRAFLKWCTRTDTGLDKTTKAIGFEDIEWSTSVLRGRWRIVSGRRVQPQENVLAEKILPIYPLRNSSLPASIDAHGTPSPHLAEYIPSAWGVLDVKSTLDPSTPHPQFLKFFHDFDWAATELGPMRNWSFELRQSCDFLLADPRPAALYWGPRRIHLYNLGYTSLLGKSKHPKCMGLPIGEYQYGFPQLFHEALATGRGAVINNSKFDVDLNGSLEEKHFSVAIIPILGDAGSIAFYSPCHEVTREIWAEQRLLKLQKISNLSAAARLDDFWSQLMSTLEDEFAVVPIVIVYKTSNPLRTQPNNLKTGSHLPSNSKSNWALVGSIGVPKGQRWFTPQLSAVGATDLFPSFQVLLSSKEPALLQSSDGTLSDKFCEVFGSLPSEERCASASFIVLRSTSSEQILGFIVVGINPKQPYDEDYWQFLQLLQRQISSGLTSAVSFETELVRAKLLADRSAVHASQITKTSETSRMSARIERLRQLAEMSTVGMFDFDLEGRLIEANDSWFKLSGHPKLEVFPSREFSFMECVYEPDIEPVTESWNKLFLGETVTFEMRWNGRHSDGEIDKSEESAVWIQACCVPVVDETGAIISIAGSTTDISPHKLAEKVQLRRTEELLALKKDQESFIDMTSHEMRNPLNAVVLSADSIAEALSSVAPIAKTLEDLSPDLWKNIEEITKTCSDGIETIISCSSHQTRIISDILTLSKLDANLLTVTPIRVRPEILLKDVQKMLGIEAQMANVQLQFQEDHSMQDLMVESVFLDPSRILQIIINLVMNAIKFTREEETRFVSVKMGASKQRQDHVAFGDENVHYHSSHTPRQDITEGPEWGTGEPLYLHFTCQDTGRGLTKEEQSRLFSRFSQASSRIHIDYGGSGLGLFISRELAELQGGGIGISSELGAGSTFAFFVKTRRADTQIPETNGAAKKRTLSEDKVRMSLVSRTILVVEDNIVNRSVLCKQLGKLGCKVFGVEHGLEAMAFIEKTRDWEGNSDDAESVSIILMDIEMPVMDGLICTRRIRGLEEEGKLKRHLPIIGISANARTEQIAESLAAGMDDAISKPFRITELAPKMAILIDGA